MTKVLSVMLTMVMIIVTLPVIKVSAVELWMWPLDTYLLIGDGYGCTCSTHKGNHRGLDIVALSGTPIKAAQKGIVERATYGTAEGNYVLIRHDNNNGLYSAYKHMNEYIVSVGSSVSQGQILGYVGSTGQSTGAHLHFEMGTGAYYSTTINPLSNPYAYIDPYNPNHGTGQHTYSYYYEATHPHREYKACSCGDWAFTGENNYEIGYENAHSHRMYYICPVACPYDHTYTGENNYQIEYEVVHPHRKYYVCPVACPFDHTFTGENNYQIEYEVVHPHRKYYVCPVACPFDHSFTGDTTTISTCSQCITPGKPVLKGISSTYCFDDPTVFQWDSTVNTTHYNIYIAVKNLYGEYTYYEDVIYATNGMTRKFSLGEYRVFLQSTNSNARTDDGSTWRFTNSDYVYFIVELEDPSTDTEATLSRNCCNFKINIIKPPTSGTIFMALYNGKKLVGTAQTSCTMSTTTLDVDVLFSEAPDKAKVFIWDSVEGMQSLSKVETITLSDS